MSQAAKSVVLCAQVIGRTCFTILESALIAATNGFSSYKMSDQSVQRFAN
jgi:hypothetical protein